MHMSSQRYINAASEYKYICILIYNTFCSATFYNDLTMITHAVAQELGPQEVKDKLRRHYNIFRLVSLMDDIRFLNTYYVVRSHQVFFGVRKLLRTTVIIFRDPQN